MDWYPSSVYACLSVCLHTHTSAKFATSRYSLSVGVCISPSRSSGANPTPDILGVGLPTVPCFPYVPYVAQVICPASRMGPFRDTQCLHIPGAAWCFSHPNVEHDYWNISTRHNVWRLKQLLWCVYVSNSVSMRPAASNNYMSLSRSTCFYMCICLYFLFIFSVLFSALCSPPFTITYSLLLTIYVILCRLNKWITIVLV